MPNTQNNRNEKHLHSAGPIGLTPDVQRGLRALIRLAIEDDFLKIREVVNKENIPPMNLENIFSLFEKNGLIKSKKGATEGYELASDPKNINLKIIIEAIQGNMNLVRCIDGDCEKIDTCRSAPVWKSLDKIIKEKFEEITLANLVESYEDKK